MDKRLANNGFTLIECLFVLMIVSVLCFGVVSYRSHYGYLDIKKLEMLSIVSQEKAFFGKRKVYISFGDQIVFDDQVIHCGLHCSSASFFYNEKGNISQANTIVCESGGISYQLVYQLGTGRVRIEKK